MFNNKNERNAKMKLQNDNKSYLEYICGLFA